MEIKISKTARHCRACEAPFKHEQDMHSAVRRIDAALEREDYCAACWRQVERAGLYSSWALRYYDAEVAQQEPPETFSPLRQLFYAAAEADERVELAKAFLAAQLLRRQKVFRQVKESDEAEGEVRTYLFADRIGNRLVEVRDPSFTYAEMDAARAALLEHLRTQETGAAGAESDTPLSEVSASTPAPAPALATHAEVLGEDLNYAAES